MIDFASIDWGAFNGTMVGVTDSWYLRLSIGSSQLDIMRLVIEQHGPENGERRRAATKNMSGEWFYEVMEYSELKRVKQAALEIDQFITNQNAKVEP